MGWLHSSVLCLSPVALIVSAGRLKSTTLYQKKDIHKILATGKILDPGQYALRAN
jgi:hypothetical protein